MRPNLSGTEKNRKRSTNARCVITKNNFVLQEFIDNPQLFVDGISRLDIVQGDLGDCWFLCACAAITLKHEIWTRVSYTGINCALQY